MDALKKQQGNPKLFINLIPRTVWFSNLRSEVTADEWKAVQKKTFSAAGYKCEICGGKGPKHPVECHERWRFDMPSRVQTLLRTVALCPACHEATHFGFACVRGIEARAFEHLKRVNKWNDVQTKQHIQEAFTVWAERNKTNWILDARWLLSFVSVSRETEEKILRHAGELETEKEKSEEEIKHTFHQQTWRDLTKEHGLDPVFLEGLATEWEADAKQQNLPLIYVWNEKPGLRETEFTLSVNGVIVGKTLERYMSRSNSWFLEIQDRIAKEINEVSLQALLKTCKRTGASPKEICFAMQRKKDRIAAERQATRQAEPARMSRPQRPDLTARRQARGLRASIDKIGILVTLGLGAALALWFLAPHIGFR